MIQTYHGRMAQTCLQMDWMMNNLPPLMMTQSEKSYLVGKNLEHSDSADEHSDSVHSDWLRVVDGGLKIAGLSQDSSLKPVESLDCVYYSLEKSAAENWICGKLSHLKSENNSFHTSNYNLMHVQSMHRRFPIDILLFVSYFTGPAYL